jgi:hypothetical protein
MEVFVKGAGVYEGLMRPLSSVGRRACSSATRISAPKYACRAGKAARAGWRCFPCVVSHFPPRGVAVETGTVARTYPIQRRTLTVEGGVPFGVAASAPVTFTTAHARAKNRHMCW